ncbi:MAG: type II toxin-antitoxin system RelE/ParE family toxin [Stagnimonas sp.]|nr:type II toxin-antitoxin system RelE/ParE family toxin [Stagnimonas sp.]
MQLFLARENPSAAMRAATTIQHQVDLLASYPELGPSDDTAAGQRKLIVPFGSNNYLVRYRLHNELVYILRVWHSREQHH